MNWYDLTNLPAVYIGCLWNGERIFPNRQEGREEHFTPLKWLDFLKSHYINRIFANNPIKLEKEAASLCIRKGSSWGYPCDLETFNQNFRIIFMVTFLPQGLLVSINNSMHIMSEFNWMSLAYHIVITSICCCLCYNYLYIMTWRVHSESTAGILHPRISSCCLGHDKCWAAVVLLCCSAPKFLRSDPKYGPGKVKAAKSLWKQ